MSEFVGKWNEWTGLESTDPIDDRRSLLLMVVSKKPSGATGQEGLILADYTNESKAFIAWGKYLTSYGVSVDVVTRFGDKPASASSWDLGEARDSTAYPRPVSEFISHLLTVDKFAARVITEYGETITALFDVSGLSDALNESRKRGYTFT